MKTRRCGKSMFNVCSSCGGALWKARLARQWFRFYTLDAYVKAFLWIRVSKHSECLADHNQRGHIYDVWTHIWCMHAAVVSIGASKGADVAHKRWIPDWKSWGQKNGVNNTLATLHPIVFISWVVGGEREKSESLCNTRLHLMVTSSSTCMFALLVACNNTRSTMFTQHTEYQATTTHGSS